MAQTKKHLVPFLKRKEYKVPFSCFIIDPPMPSDYIISNLHPQVGDRNDAFEVPSSDG